MCEYAYTPNIDSLIFTQSIVTYANICTFENFHSTETLAHTSIRASWEICEPRKLDIPVHMLPGMVTPS